MRSRSIQTKSYKSKLKLVGLGWVDTMGLINSTTTEVRRMVRKIVMIMVIRSIRMLISLQFQVLICNMTKDQAAICKEVRHPLCSQLTKFSR